MAEEQRSEVELAREQLAATLAALTYKVNAPRRAKDEAAARVHQLSARAKRLVGR
jgi:hypothetical protein